MSTYARAKLVTQPAEDPITAAEAKLHLRVTHSIEDDLITADIAAARATLESKTHRAFIAQTWAVYLDSFPQSGCPIHLPRAPAASITSISYVDAAGDSQTLATSVYELESGAEPASIWLQHNQSWPETRRGVNAVTVTYVAGLADRAAAQAAEPQLIKALKLLCGHYYRHRESVIVGPNATNLPQGVADLIAPRVIHSVAFGE